MNIKRLKKKKHNGFVLFVGEEGAVLTYHEQNKVERRLYSSSPEAQTTETFVKLFEEFPDASVSILVDSMDQSYTKHTLPPVSSLGIKKIIDRRLARDYDPKDITGALSLGREKTGRKDWNFLLIALAYDHAIKGWCELLYSVKNRLKGIYLLPVESEFIIRDMVAAMSAAENSAPEKKKKKTFSFSKKNKAEEETRWDMMVVHNKTGGFRQVVLKNGTLVFTRLAQMAEDEQSSVVAGNIEQETKNTIEYLKRMSFNDEKTLHITFILGQQLKGEISPSEFGNVNISVFTPHEMAQMLGLEKAVLSGDRYCDVLLSATFQHCKKHRLRLSTKETQQSQAYHKAMLGVKYGTALAGIAGIGFIGYTGYEGYVARDELLSLETKQRQISSRLSEFEARAATFDVDPLAVDSLIKIHDFIMREQPDYQHILEKLYQAVDENTLLERLDWAVREANESNASRGGNSRGRPVPPNAATQSAPIEELKMTLALNVYEDNQQDFITRWDGIYSNIESLFEGYMITRPEIAGFENRQDALNINFEERQSTFQSMKSGQRVTVTLSASSLNSKGDKEGR